MKHDLLSSFVMDDMDGIFLPVLDSTFFFLFWNNIDIGEYVERKYNSLVESWK